MRKITNYKFNPQYILLNITYKKYIKKNNIQIQMFVYRNNKCIILMYYCEKNESRLNMKPLNLMEHKDLLDMIDSWEKMMKDEVII